METNTQWPSRKSERQCAHESAVNFAEELHMLCVFAKWMVPAALLLGAFVATEVVIILAISPILPISAALDHLPAALKYLSWQQCISIVRARFL